LVEQNEENLPYKNSALIEKFSVPSNRQHQSDYAFLRLRGKVICCAALCMTVVHNDMHQGQIYGGGAVGVIPPFPPRKVAIFLLSLG